MFAGKITFLDVLNKLLTKIPNGYNTMEWNIIDNVILVIDALLFNSIPWFGANYQLPDVTFENKLKEILLVKKKYIDNCLCIGLCSDKIRLESRLTQISGFIQYLDRLITDIESGLRWRGLSDFQPRVENLRDKTTLRGVKAAL